MNYPGDHQMKSIIVTLWLKWEKLFNTVFSMKAIDGENDLLHYRIRKYQGRKVKLNNGEEIKRGDRIAELHFNNALFFQALNHSRSSVHLAVRLLREAEILLPKLAGLLKRQPEHKRVKAVYGISMIYKGTEQFGFTVKDLPKGIFSFFTRKYLQCLLIILHPQGKKRMKAHPEFWKPKIIAMSLNELFEKYDPGRTE
ncbi:MAG TPA: hypothetical protein VFK33_01795 [Bacillales bacterium]|nr:hypothetical protein [Bacillales bacterium]